MSLISKVQQYVASVQTDFPASLGMLSEDVHWVNLLPANVPFGGEYKGHAGIIEYFEAMGETFELGQYHFDKFEFIETENTVVMSGFEERAKVPATGKIFDLHFVWIVKFNDDGKIQYLREYNDTAAIGDAFKQ